MDPVDLYERAADGAVTVLSRVTSPQLSFPTPCSKWSVQDLLDHMAGSTEYLAAAVVGRAPEVRAVATAADFARGAGLVRAALAVPGALEQVCLSPLGFEWTIAEALLGTVMDTVIHTWDLATATGQDVVLDPLVVAMCVETFLPEMPERGRAAGLVGPAVTVAADAPPHVRLLGAMGRHG